MDPAEVKSRYHDYIDCLNRRDWWALGTFVADELTYNGEAMDLADYRALLAGNCENIPDLRFRIDRLVVEGAVVASRLLFDCTPIGTFMGLPVNGRRVSFAENVFYEMAADRIVAVWSVIDKAAIEDQLARARPR